MRTSNRYFRGVTLRLSAGLLMLASSCAALRGQATVAKPAKP